MKTMPLLFSTLRRCPVLDAEGQLVYMNEAAKQLTQHALLPEMTELKPRFPDGRPVLLGETPLRRALRGENVDDLTIILTKSDGSDAWVDVTATLERKIDALRAHRSQIDDPESLGGRIRSWAAEVGARIGAPAAECFRIIDIDDDDDEPPDDRPA